METGASMHAQTADHPGQGHPRHKAQTARSSGRGDGGFARPRQEALRPRRASREGQALQSVHAPEVECISKGKAHRRYEFGCKVALAVSSKGGWVLAAQALEGNPYDGHTLQSTMDRIVATSGVEPEHAYVDMGYRGHDYEGECEVHVGRRRRGSIAKSLWGWVRRRAAIEPSLGHLKEHTGVGGGAAKGKGGGQSNP